MLSRRLRLLAVYGSLFSTSMLFTGCTESVREDRSINFSEGGDNVGFQHGDDGVFVANPETGEVERVFDPEDEVLASSSPLWSPVGNQLIFATARSADPNERTIRAVQPWDASPAGRRFPKGEITYTCWLRAAPTTDNPTPKPQPLFEAACDHPGYVASNLAVRWHPDGGSVYFVDRLTKGRLGLFGFELATGQRRRVGRLSGSALLFDWSPGGKHLSCVVVDGKELLLNGELAEQFARDSYVAEVYLSLDLAEDGVQNFEQMLANTQTGAERFVHAVIFSQLLLLTQRCDDYAQLAVETIAPFCLKLSQSSRDSQDARPELREVVYLSFCLLPMFSPEFLAELDRGRLEKCINTIREISTQDRDYTGRLGIDLFLHAAFTVLGVNEKREEADRRIEENPRTKELLSGESVAGLQALIAEACEFRW